MWPFRKKAAERTSETRTHRPTYRTTSVSSPRYQAPAQSNDDVFMPMVVSAVILSDDGSRHTPAPSHSHSTHHDTGHSHSHDTGHNSGHDSGGGGGDAGGGGGGGGE